MHNAYGQINIRKVRIEMQSTTNWNQIVFFFFAVLVSFDYLYILLKPKNQYFKQRK